MTTATATHREVANRGLLVVSVMLATLMQALDTTIANVALPNMQGSLSATQDQISWVLTSYIVAAAIATPATGWLASVMGRRRLLLIAIAGFTVASVLCGIAGSIGQMVAFRLLQGLFGAALVPLSQSTLLDVYPREKHGSAMAISSRRLRPITDASQPVAGVAIAAATMYEVRTQEIWSCVADSEPCMFGSATFAIVVSSACISVASMTDTTSRPRLATSRWVAA